ncbi:MAG: PIN domain-containing protein, partial [Spirochaetaceae bacterium]|nr:PIN domain-containing protein [Spirochaetaceae bacterium]
MNVFVLDSNIVSFYIRQDRKIIQKVQDELIAGNEILIGPIAYYEVKRGLMAINAQKRLREFTDLCTVLGLGRLDNALLDTAAEIYVELREKKETMEDADIMTAAFCKIHDFTLVTHNTRHFDGIS